MKQMVLVALAMTLAVACALPLSASQGVAAKGRPGPLSPSYIANPPDAFLMKGPIVLQKGLELSRCWSYHFKGRGLRGEGCADAPLLVPRLTVPLLAGETGLHIRLDKPQRPQRVELRVYNATSARYGKNPLPTGRGRRLEGHTFLRRVEQGGKTVAWDVFFRLPRPARHYYLEAWAKWKRVPNATVSTLDADYTFNVWTF